MGFFEFVLALAFITTAGRIVQRRLAHPQRGQSLQVDTEELLRIREMIGDLSGRLERLEEERDFYKDLLEPREGRRELPPANPKD